MENYYIHHMAGRSRGGRLAERWDWAKVGHGGLGHGMAGQCLGRVSGRRGLDWAVR
jgi:hypothetical protein